MFMKIFGFLKFASIRECTLASYPANARKIYTAGSRSELATQCGTVVKQALLLAALTLSLPMRLDAAPLLWASINGEFVSFRADAPGTIIRTVNDAGIASEVGGMDFRLTTGELYVLYRISSGTSGDSVELRKLNLVSGYAATLGTVGLPLLPQNSAVGMAFDPYSDRIRLITNKGNHIPVNPDTGASEGFYSALNYVAGDSGGTATPGVAHVAFSQAVVQPSTTTFYGIDSTRNVLVRIGPANTPTLSTSSNVTTISALSLGFNPDEFGGFVIDPETNIGYLAASLIESGVYVAKLYSVQLFSGTANFIGYIGPTGGTRVVRGLALAPEINRCLDIDGDGQVLANRDGLMYTRILLGLTGTAVTANAMSTLNPPPRNTWAAIRSHLVNHCGMTLAP
jgi:Domain of unknown function (DUF4394)